MTARIISRTVTFQKCIFEDEMYPVRLNFKYLAASRYGVERNEYWRGMQTQQIPKQRKRRPATVNVYQLSFTHSQSGTVRNEKYETIGFWMEIYYFSKDLIAFEETIYPIIQFSLGKLSLDLYSLLLRSVLLVMCLHVAT